MQDWIGTETLLFPALSHSYGLTFLSAVELRRATEVQPGTTAGGMCPARAKNLEDFRRIGQRVKARDILVTVER